MVASTDLIRKRTLPTIFKRVNLIVKLGLYQNKIVKFYTCPLYENNHAPSSSMTYCLIFLLWGLYVLLLLFLVLRNIYVLHL